MEASLTVECLERRIPSTALGLRLGETMSPHQILKKGIMSESWATCPVTPSEAAHKYSQGLTAKALTVFPETPATWQIQCKGESPNSVVSQC